jgi:hypothetical protein
MYTLAVPQLGYETSIQSFHSSTPTTVSNIENKIPVSKTANNTESTDYTLCVKYTSDTELCSTHLRFNVFSNFQTIINIYVYVYSIQYIYT